MKRYMSTAAVCLLATASITSAAALINDDFQTGMGAWSSTTWTRVDVGGGQYMLEGASGLATNPTKIPAAIQFDFDIQRTTTSVGSGPRIFFHSRTSSNLTAVKGYWLRYMDDYNADRDGLQFWEKVADYGAENMIGFAAVTLDLNVHHVRLIDDGVGHFRVYFDNMVTPVLVVDDSGSYLGANDQYIGVGYMGRIDNIVVYGDDPPDAVTDLAAGNPDWFKLDLTWTAPTDYPLGPVAAYDIRYSTSTITEGNWASATPCGSSPAVLEPGQTQTTTVSGLSAGTTYYFALKSRDAGNKWSALSNVASGTTGPLDVIAPSAVSDLSFSNVQANRVTLSWTATGDDGMVGVADRYDVRYATEPLTEGNWDTASQATAEPTPKAPGQTETWILRGLAPVTTYYVAIKVGDEVPNFSAISNVVTFTTPVADLTAPDAIADLRLTGTHIKAAFLTWTAPVDLGGTGCGEYDLRYSTSPIDAGNFDSATQVAGEPAPAAPGTRQSMTVSGLLPDTLYYFAIKTADNAEPANVSLLSNVVSGRTMPPVAPVKAINPWISNDRVADCRTLATMAATFDKSYTPDGVVSPSPTDIQTRAINVYNNFKRRLYHWGEMPTANDDVVSQLNIFGWALCGSQAGMNAAILLQMGLHPRTISIASGGHTFWEIEYGGKWHALDTMTTFYVYDRNTPPQIVSMADVKADKNLVYNAVAEGRACPGFLLCGDTPQYFADGSDTWAVKADPGNTATTKSMNMELAMGQSLKRTWESWATQYYNYPTNSPPYHHESQYDWKDTVNILYWEPYSLDTAGNAAIGITKSMTYRRWANGTITLSPDFRSAGYQAALVSSSNIATFNDDSLTPDLHTAATGSLATAVYKIVTPFYMTDGSIDATFFRNAPSDINRLFVSPDGSVWTKIWENTSTGTTQVSGANVRTQVFGKYQMWVRIELQSTTAITDAGVSNLVMTASFEHNKGGMAYLDKGVNHITVTFDNPQDFASGASLKVVYKWKENNGSGWTVDRDYTQYVTTSPATFTITTAGTKVPRTEYILLEVTEPPMPDGSAPAPVTDLTVTGTDSTRIDLAWTAPGDDWNSGTAASYDLRYSTSMITEGNWDAATQVTGEPSPQVAGSAETFTVTGLAPLTTYYFAIKARDEGGNIADLSNIAVGTTLAPDLTPPAWVTNLVAHRSTAAGGVDLTWTAPGDDGVVGTAASYDLRYSTAPIDAGNFAAATVVGGVPAPKAAGQAESFTVTGLAGGTFYYFALKVTDDSANTSEISNVAHAFASVLGEKVLQDGVAGYTGCSDNYMEASAPTTAYGDRERMRICGYADSDPLNRQRALVKFDLSSIPAGTQLTRATLYLYAYDEASRRGSTGYYGAYPLTRTWQEIGSCWNLAATGTSWTTPGSDFVPTADALSPKFGYVDVWYPFNVTARVQSWLNGTSTNYGWCIKVDDENRHNQDLFYSSDSPSAPFRPKLVLSDLPAAVTGDINGDGAVDATDVLILADSWAKHLGERGYDPLCDLTSDQTVDVSDLLIVASHWNP
jgi:hypothetical protein